MMGSMFCQYETPCGICTRTGLPCTERGRNKPKPQIKIATGHNEDTKGAVKDE
jgi:hypothetical protein